MNIRLTGIYTPPLPETRDLAMVEVDHNNTTYNWKVYIPQGQNLQTYLDSQEIKIKSEIDAKELEWENLNPKYTLIDDIDGGQIQVEISKDSVVCAEIPDYYAKRRDSYPAIGDQLGAIWKGVDSPEFQQLLADIEAVKAKYPK